MNTNCSYPCFYTDTYIPPHKIAALLVLLAAGCALQLVLRFSASVCLFVGLYVLTYHMPKIMSRTLFAKQHYFGQPNSCFVVATMSSLQV